MPGYLNNLIKPAIIGIAVVAGALFLPTAVLADDVALFSFVTDPQHIDVGVISSAITIQSQSSPGVPQPISETYDLSFTTTSSAGSFLNSSGNPVSTTMSKNTANRSFYYKDNTAGDIVLTVTAVGRDSKKTFTATQHIFVAQPLPDDGGGGGTATTTPAEDTSPAKNDNYAPAVSAHSSPAPLSGAQTTIDFEISAGRNRLATVGNSTIFQAVPTKLQNVSADHISYQWSFGDGSSGQGATITHAYRFPGEYIVILNGSFSDRQAVSRAVVTVISPQLGVSRLAGGVDIWNKSGTEINLEGWTIRSGARDFMLPKDTIIEAGKHVVFADEVTGIHDDSVEVIDQLHRIYASTATVPSSSVLPDNATTTVIDLDAVEAKLQMVRQTLASLYPQVERTALPSQSVAVQERSEQSASEETLLDEAPEQTAAVVDAFVAPVSTGTITRIFAWPIKGFEFIRHLFVED